MIRLKSHADCAVCNKRKARRKWRRDRWIAAGACPLCGGARGRYQYCVECRVKECRMRKELRMKKRRMRIAA